MLQQSQHFLKAFMTIPIISKLNRFLVSNVYSKYNTITKGTLFETAFIRRNHESLPESALSDVNAFYSPSAILDILQWNGNLKNPVVQDSDIGAYTAQDWAMLEKELCLAQLKECTHDFIPERYSLMEDELIITYNSLTGVQNPIFKGILATSIVMVSPLIWIYFTKIMPYVGTLGTLTGLVVTALGIVGLFKIWQYIGALLTWSVMGWPQGDAIAEQISSTWDEVFEEKTLQDGLLVSMLIQFYKKSANNHAPVVDFRTIAPKNVFHILSSNYTSHQLFEQFKALTPIPKTVEDEYTGVPVPNFSAIVELQQSAERTINRGTH
jgi:hypothetical protein